MKRYYPKTGGLPAPKESGEQTFFIDGKLPSLNDVIDANRSNRYQGAAMKRDAENAIIIGIKTARLKPIDVPVRIHYRWIEPDRRRDWDNVVSARKFVQDALVKAGILKNDGQQHIDGFSDSFDHNKDKPGCWVTIEELQ